MSCFKSPKLWPSKWICHTALTGTTEAPAEAPADGPKEQPERAPAAAASTQNQSAAAGPEVPPAEGQLLIPSYATQKLLLILNIYGFGQNPKQEL